MPTHHKEMLIYRPPPSPPFTLSTLLKRILYISWCVIVNNTIEIFDGSGDQLISYHRMTKSQKNRLCFKLFEVFFCHCRVILLFCLAISLSLFNTCDVRISKLFLFPIKEESGVDNLSRKTVCDRNSIFFSIENFFHVPSIGLHVFFMLMRNKVNLVSFVRIRLEIVRIRI